MNRTSKRFLRMCCCVLFFTAAAKLWTVFGGGTQLLVVLDPVLGVEFRTVMIVSALMEIAVGMVCLLRPSVDGLVSVVWLGVLIVSYRTAVWQSGWTKPCGCLGNLTDVLHISPELADNVMKGVLAFMLSGGISLLILHWRRVGSVNQRAINTSSAAVD